MRYLFILFAVSFLPACVNQVELAKRAMDQSVLRDIPIQYDKIHSYPGNVVCGQYTVSRKKREDQFSPFIYRAKKIDVNPSTLDVAIFCSEDPQRNLSVITGIDLSKCSESQLPEIMADFRAIVGALTLYETDNGSLPRNRQGLEALIRPSTIQPIPRGFKTGGYLTELPADPWGNAYLYKGPTFGGSKGQYTIRTLGSDGVAGGAAESADIDSEYLKYIDHIGGCGSAS